MFRIPKKELSRHPKGYRICVGQHQGADGKIRPRTFWLGDDPITAHYAANEYQAAWSRLKWAGGSLWTEEAIQTARDFIARFVAIRAEMHDGLRQRIENLEARKRGVEKLKDEITFMFGPRPGDPILSDETQAVAENEEESQQSPPTLYAAVDRYLAVLNDKRRADSHKARAERILNVDLKRAQKDCSLSEIDYLWIDRLCDHFKNRPLGRKNGKRLAANTVATTLRYLRAFFIWIDDTSFGGWEAPRKLAKPFRCNVRDLMTPAELKASGSIKQFDRETLRKLYAAASDFQKCLMLMGLFTGATQQELSILEKGEFDLDRSELIHFRNKTKIEGRFWLPPELVDLVKKQFQRDPGDAVAFRTSEGRALVTFRDGREVSDAVRQTWDDLRRAAGVPNALSFKYLRKFLGDWMMRHAGESLAQVALSHVHRVS